MKRLIIFITIFLTLSVGLIAFFSVKPKAAPNIKFYENQKFYFKDYQTYYQGDDYSFNFTFIDEYYDYFIFNFGDNVSRDLYVMSQTKSTFVNTGVGVRITDRNDLKWVITFDESFDNEDFYFVAFNYEYLFNLNENLRSTAIDFRNLGISEGQGIGYQEAIDVGYDWGYKDGKIVGYNEGKKAGILEGASNANDFSFGGLLAQVFAGLGSLLAINLLPGISIGAIIAVPIVFGIIYFIIGKRGGSGD